MKKEFAEDVSAGLSAKPKFLPSRYFYDEAGDKLFQRIMALDEYYLTQAEYGIFSNHKSEFLKLFRADAEEFHVIEFGAGDGYKTRVLLDYFVEANAKFKYMPIDISSNVLRDLVKSLRMEMPKLEVEGLHGEYFSTLETLETEPEVRNIIFFLGSNIGNFQKNEAIKFLSHIAEDMGREDYLMIGFDLKKDPEKIRRAYNDSAGITRQFNLNLLTRINRELGGNFDISKFVHWPVYDPFTGAAKSYLVSREMQSVQIDTLQETYHFKAWEAIFMEISQKYDLEMIEELASASGFRLVNNFFDPNRYFVDSVWQLNDLQ